MDQGVYEIKVPFASGKKHLREEFTIDDLKNISSPIIDEAIQPIWDALDKADLRPEDIDLVILAGGSSQLPGVYEKIENAIGKAPRIIPKNLMLAISYGAALYQREIFNLPKARHDVRTLGTSLAISVDDGGRRAQKLLLNHNEKLPALKEYRFSVSEGQTEASINLVTLAGNTDRVEKKLRQRNLQLKKGASEIVVKIQVTENRLIELSAYDPKNPGDKAIIQVDSQSLSEQDIIDRRKELGIEVITSDARKNIQPCVGIDLGTTTTEFTYTTRSNEIDLQYLVNPEVPSQYSEYCFPSIVYFRNGSETPEVANVTADDARGDSAEAMNVCENFKIARRDRNFITVNGKGRTVRDLSTILLNKVWETAKHSFGDINLQNAVITVPAAFDFDACQETYDAAKLAGINNVVLIDEPTAAYLYYRYVQDLDTSRIRNVLVFDFGGGTADVAVLDVAHDNQAETNEYKDCLYKVLGVSGTNCGGKKVDEAIVESIKKKFERENECVLQPTALKNLRAQVEKAKVALSEYYSELGDQ